MKKNDLSVIIVSYNTRKILMKCLAKLKSSIKFVEDRLPLSVKVIVVDNGSKDGTSEAIEKRFPEVKIIRNKINVGFGRANNQAMKSAITNYILLLNSDVFVGKHTLYDTYSYMSENNSIDVMGVRLSFADGSFQPCGGNLPTPWRTSLWILGVDALPVVKYFTRPIHQLSPYFYMRKRRLEWLSGAFFVLRREVFEKTGGFDEELAMYTEDIEWCKRINDLGFKIFFNPKIGVTHLVGASSSSGEKTIENVLKGIIYFHKKHYPDTLQRLIKIIRFGVSLRYLFFRLLKNQTKKNAYLRIKSKMLKKYG